MQIVEFTPKRASDCKVTAWLHKDHEGREKIKSVKPAIIICPGGGYGCVSDREAEPVAKYYFEAGYHTFILRYSVMDEAKNFKPLMQLAATIAHIRQKAEEWKIERNQIAVCGFSAGGHLAASLGVLADTPEFREVYRTEENIRPDAMILVYPVITSDKYAHENSICRVSGSYVGTDKYEWFGLERHVDKNTPPTFLCHTAADEKVPVENSLKMAGALSAAKIPFELHIFPEGAHGMSVCDETVGEKCEYNGRWVEWSIRWLNRFFRIESES